MQGTWKVTDRLCSAHTHCHRPLRFYRWTAQPGGVWFGDLTGWLIIYSMEASHIGYEQSQLLLWASVGVRVAISCGLSQSIAPDHTEQGPPLRAVPWTAKSGRQLVDAIAQFQTGRASGGQVWFREGCFGEWSMHLRARFHCICPKLIPSYIHPVVRRLRPSYLPLLARAGLPIIRGIAFELPKRTLVH